MSNQRRKETLLTYEEWQNAFKKHLRMYVKKKLHDLMYDVGLFFMLVVPPMVMIAHYIVVGY